MCLAFRQHSGHFLCPVALRSKSHLRILASRPIFGPGGWVARTRPPFGLTFHACATHTGELRCTARRSTSCPCKGEFCMPHTPAPEEMNGYQNAEARFEAAAT